MDALVAQYSLACHEEECGHEEELELLDPSLDLKFAVPPTAHVRAEQPQLWI